MASVLKNLLDRFSMYRTVVWYLSAVWVVAVAFSLLRLLPYDPLDILSSGLFLIAVSYGANELLARIFKRPANPESAIITGLILALIVGPAPLLADLVVLFAVASLAILSKYVLAWRGKHIFNPAAAGAAAVALILGRGASWWVGNPYLLPFVAVGGMILLLKIKRIKMAVIFVSTYALLLFVASPDGLQSLELAADLVRKLLVFSPILFFVFVMLPEPQTSPNRTGQVWVYAAFTALAAIIYGRTLPIPYTFELALLSGNILTFIMSPTQKFKLTLVRREKLAESIYGFWFKPNRRIDFEAGQYLHYTLYHRGADDRGLRRYFTITSAPTESEILLATKFAEKSSSFKKKLKDLELGDLMSATGPLGDFVLPGDPRAKLAFIAGGIGVTPFRSMVKYLSDKNESRDIRLLYAAGDPEEFAFRETLGSYRGLQISYETERLDAERIRSRIPDWSERLFYLSGPEGMVENLSGVLQSMGVDPDKIKHDYFPGYEEI